MNIPKKKFGVVHGGREELERVALYAVFQSPSEFSNLLSQLKPRTNIGMQLIQHSSVSASVDKINIR